ncbi:MAG: M56 family metallopeptidase [Verrucomicrobiales bacterium]
MNTIETIFDWFLSATARGSLLALAVILMQMALRRRLPATWNLALWLPVVWVLGSPVLPESPWSIEGPIQSISVLAEPSPVDPVIDPVEVSPDAASAALGREAVSWKRIAAIVWLGGAGVVLCLGIAAYFRELRRMGRKQIPASPLLMEELAAAAHACGLRRIPRVVISREAHSPAVTGLFRPLLLLPAHFSSAFDQRERHLILLHELFHLRRFDLPANWLLFVLQALHWCNPVIWIAFGRLRADRERACDSAVLAASEEDRRGVYGHTLLKLENTGNPTGLSLAFVGLFGRNSALSSRVEAIAMHRHSHPAWAVPGMALILFLVLAGATRAQTEVGAGPEPGRQISIETKFIEVPADLKFEVLGVSSTYEAERGLIVFVQNAEDSESFIDSLTKIPSVDMLGSPTVVARSGQIAAVETGTERSDTSGTKKKVGITLEILPTLNGGQIGLQIEALSTRAANAATGEILKEIPEGVGITFSETRLESTASITPGQTVVIVETETKADTKTARRLIVTLRALLPEGSTALRKKFDEIILPRVDFREASLAEAVAYLREQGRALDPAKSAVNIVVSSDSGAADMKLSLSLTRVPLSEALKYTAALCGLDVEYGDSAVMIRKAVAPIAPAPGTMSAEESRISRIVIPKMEFREADLTNVIEFLQARSMEVDPEKEGVNFRLSLNPKRITAKISLNLTNVPLNQAVRYVAELAGLKVRYAEDGVLLFQE